MLDPEGGFGSPINPDEKTLAETLLDGQTEKLVGKCVQMALDGDSAAMKVCMDRLIPPVVG
jgi:hypothetical protein